MIHIFNEELYAKKMLEKGFQSNKQGLELFILAKYYRFEKHLNKSECKALLKDFCTKEDSNYAYTDMYKKVNSAIAGAYNKKAQFLKIDYIEFDINELNYINSLNISSACKQVLFGLWCCNKLNIQSANSDKWVSIGFQELKKFCNLKNGNMLSLLHELYANCLIFTTDKCAVCCLFLDEYKKYLNEVLKTSDDPHPIRLELKHFTTCGLWWRRYNGDKRIIECSDCKKLTVRNSNAQIYCKECNPKHPIETKFVQCVDCEMWFEIDAKDTKTNRCSDCYKEYRKKYKAEKEKERRAKLKERGQTK